MTPVSFPIKDAAEYLRCSMSYVEALIKDGVFTCHSLRDGGDRRISRWQLDAYVEQREGIGIKRKTA